MSSGGYNFSAPVALTTGASPSSVAIGDVNGDNKLDLVASNSGASTVSVFLGNGNGTFGTKTDYTAASGGIGIRLADINGDGNLDVVEAVKAANAVSILLGNGTGAFSAHTEITTGASSSPTSTALGDINGDGRLDLVVANKGTGTIGILLGSGGSFGAQTTISAVSGVTSAELADVNNDGKLDLLATDFNGNKVQVRIGNGNGTFGAATSYAVRAGPNHVVAGDLNGDGRLDLVTANFSGNSVSVLFGNGDGTFQSQTEYTSGQSAPYTVTLADMDGDGRLDILASHGNGSTVPIRYGSGTFVQSAAYTITDVTPPAAPSISQVVSDSGAPGDHLTTDRTLTITGSGAVEPGGKIAIYDGSTFLGFASIHPSLASWTYTTAPLADGAHSLTAKQLDLGGNYSAASTAYEMTVDTVAPTATIARVNGPSTNASTADFLVSFSETVTGVDASDFSLATSGVTGASIVSVVAVSGSNGRQYSVNVNTGSGDGTIGLSLANAVGYSIGGEIRDIAGNPLAGGQFAARTTLIRQAVPASRSQLSM